MPVSKKQSTTSTNAPSASERAHLEVEDQPPFHQQLREQIRHAVQMVMETIPIRGLTAELLNHEAEIIGKESFCSVQTRKK